MTTITHGWADANRDVAKAIAILKRVSAAVKTDHKASLDDCLLAHNVGSQIREFAFALEQRIEKMQERIDRRAEGKVQR